MQVVEVHVTLCCQLRKPPSIPNLSAIPHVDVYQQVHKNSKIRIPEVLIYLFITFLSWVYCNLNHQKYF